MRRLDERFDQPLAWIPTRGRTRCDELRSGGHVLAQLSRTPGWRQQTEAITALGTWHLRRAGLLRQRLVASDAASGAEAAVFRPDWRGEGVLAFREGGTFQLRCMSAGMTRWAVLDRTDDLLLEYELHPLSFHSGAGLIITDAARERSELSLLVAMGWFLVIAAADDASVASAITAASAATMGLTAVTSR
jgi:hypothetical protein